jgi:hypothetical protein
MRVADELQCMAEALNLNPDRFRRWSTDAYNSSCDLDCYTQCCSYQGRAFHLSQVISHTQIMSLEAPHLMQVTCEHEHSDALCISELLLCR